MLHLTRTSGKLRDLWVQRLKHFYSLFQNADSILNIYIFISYKPPRDDVYRPHKTQTHTHTNTSTRQDQLVAEADLHKKQANRRTSMPWTRLETAVPKSMPWKRLETAVPTVQRPPTAWPHGPAIVYLLHIKLIENTHLVLWSYRVVNEVYWMALCRDFISIECEKLDGGDQKIGRWKLCGNGRKVYNCNNSTKILRVYLLEILVLRVLTPSSVDSAYKTCRQNMLLLSSGWKWVVCVVVSLCGHAYS